MAKLVCSISSVYFHCEHLPITLTHREYHHPMFSIPQKTLLTLYGQWVAQKLTHTESYLLFLSLLASSDLVTFRVPVQYNDSTTGIIANNMHQLVSIISKINLISHPSFSLPQFIVSAETCALENVEHWIGLWVSNYNDWMNDKKSSDLKERIKHKLEIRQNSLERLIKSAHTKEHTLVHSLAEWADIAGYFPEHNIKHSVTGKIVKHNEYWKDIIRACINDEAVWAYPASHIAKLIDHCNDYIPHGNISAHKLMETLRAGYKKNQEYLGIGDIDLAGKRTTFSIMDASASELDIAVSAMISAAPLKQPVLSDYPTKLAYLKAKINYETKARYSK
jgi:hypothetical protein